VKTLYINSTLITPLAPTVIILPTDFGFILRYLNLTAFVSIIHYNSEYIYVNWL